MFTKENASEAKRKARSEESIKGLYFYDAICCCHCPVGARVCEIDQLHIKSLRKKIGTAPIMMVGACVLIFNEQRQLVQKRIDNHYWGLYRRAPDGRLGETLRRVATHMSTEETGLTPRPQLL